HNYHADSMDELFKLMAELSLSLQTIFQNWPIANGQGSSVSGPPRSQNLRPSSSTRRGPFKCIWCDSTEHIRRDCAELTAALNAGVTRYNEKGHLVNGVSGEELPLMFDKGGMKKVIGATLPQSSPVAASTRNITIDEVYGRLGGDSILRTTL